jgi:hypothetical protein
MLGNIRNEKSVWFKLGMSLESGINPRSTMVPRGSCTELGTPENSLKEKRVET